MRIVPLKVQGAIGRKLLKVGYHHLLKSAQLEKREVVLSTPGAGSSNTANITMHYYERQGEFAKDTEEEPPPTLLLLHGFTDEARNMAPMVQLLAKRHPKYRMIVPDLYGHGHDLERVQQDGVDNFDYPTPKTLLETMEIFLTVMNIKQCYAIGISMGGALAYWLQQQRPDVIPKCILISPAVEYVVDETFLDDFTSGRKNQFCVESRQDVKQCFRDLSFPGRKKKDPVPKFFLQAIWEDKKAREPWHHFRTFFTKILKERGKDDLWASPMDTDPALPRLVIWPERDLICNYEKGKAFFAKSHQTTFHTVPNCGHLFHSNGKNIMELVAPLIANYIE